jgi:hypothetical protein
MNYNITPKDEFCKDARAVADHHVLVENPIVRRSISSALAEYHRRQCRQQANDLGGAAYCFMRMQGASELVDLLYNLAESTSEVRAADSVNLPGNIPPGRNTIPLSKH